MAGKAAKVTLGGETLVDLTDSTITAGDLRDGVTAYDKTGSKITGNATYETIVSGNMTAVLISGENYKMVFS